MGSNRSTSRGAYRLEIGHKMGADVILSYEENNVVETILAAVPTGVDRVIVTAPPGQSKTLFKYPASGASLPSMVSNLEQEAKLLLTPTNSTSKNFNYGLPMLSPTTIFLWLSTFWSNALSTRHYC